MFEIIYAVLLFVASIVLLYYLVTKALNYWKKRNVVYLTPLPLSGKYADSILLKKPSEPKLCQNYKKEPYFGSNYETKPALFVQDPEIIKPEVTKHFPYFNSRELMEYSHKDFTIRNIFFKHGETWIKIKHDMTPLFSSAKLKHMIYKIVNCAPALEYTLEHSTSKANNIAARPLMTRYTVDCICSFDVDSDALHKNAENNPFTMIGKAIFTRDTISGRIFFSGFKLYSTNIDNFFHQLITGVFESCNYTSIQRHDFFASLLNQYKNNSIVGDNKSIIGVSNSVLGLNNSIIGDNNRIDGNNNSIVGNNNYINGDNNSIVGDSDRIYKDHNSIVGHNNIIRGYNNSIVNDNNTITGDDSSIVGNNNSIVGNHDSIVGNDKSVVGDNKHVVGRNKSRSSPGGEQQQTLVLDDSMMVTCDSK